MSEHTGTKYMFINWLSHRKLTLTAYRKLPIETKAKIYREYLS